ncbi:MAG: hypothetical protein HPY59_01385 [Anaerolineae bacterium]|nr:hypothetical protein [Anaerolineae bacterium]
MVKTIGRILIILSLAALISSALYLLVSVSGSSSALPFRQEELGEHLSEGLFAGPALEGGGFPVGRGSHSFESRRARDLHGVELSIAYFGVLRNLGVIALITLVVVMVQKAWGRIFRKKNFTPSG